MVVFFYSGIFLHVLWMGESWFFIFKVAGGDFVYPLENFPLVIIYIYLGLGFPVACCKWLRLHRMRRRRTMPIITSEIGHIQYDV